MATAWHLRSDGQAFPIKVHIYPMQDDNLASEAEVAAFIIKTNSKDQDYAEFVLDAFMALEIENIVPYDADASAIQLAIESRLTRLPFKFAYPLSTDEMLRIHESQGNYYDIDTLYDFIDEVRRDLDIIQTTIKDSFNQQFCRVRFGGKFNTVKGNNCIWFRIASVDYNWDNTIYTFTSEMKNRYNIEYITICRDPESDGRADDDDYFYKAKDGTAYYYMPLDEFFTEEHEHNPVFSATDIGAGVINTIRNQLRRGNTIQAAYNYLNLQGITLQRDYRPYLLKTEIARNCISASEWFDQLNTRTKMKLGKMENMIKRDYPEILSMDIDFEPRENRNGKPVGFELLCTLTSEHPQIDNQVISIVSTKSLSSTMADTLAAMFRREYEDFIEYKKIRL